MDPQVVGTNIGNNILKIYSDLQGQTFQRVRKNEVRGGLTAPAYSSVMAVCNTDEQTFQVATEVVRHSFKTPFRKSDLYNFNNYEQGVTFSSDSYFYYPIGSHIDHNSIIEMKKLANSILSSISNNWEKKEYVDGYIYTFEGENKWQATHLFKRIINALSLEKTVILDYDDFTYRYLNVRISPKTDDFNKIIECIQSIAIKTDSLYQKSLAVVLNQHPPKEVIDQLPSDIQEHLIEHPFDDFHNETYSDFLEFPDKINLSQNV